MPVELVRGGIAFGDAKGWLVDGIVNYGQPCGDAALVDVRVCLVGTRPTGVTERRRRNRPSARSTRSSERCDALQGGQGAVRACLMLGQDRTSYPFGERGSRGAKEAVEMTQRLHWIIADP
jgi:hypothetical protein